MLGYTSQFSVIYNRNRDNNGVVFDSNGFIARPSSLGTERPRTYDVVYFGFNGDEHFGRLKSHQFLLLCNRRGGKRDIYQQAVGQVALSRRNGILNSLRSSKELGQSNFTNPGIILLGAGADFEILPELRLSLNANYLWFDETQVLEVARQQAGIDNEIGLDFSVSVIYRPLMSQNIVLRASYAALFAGEGYKDLFPTNDLPQSLLTSITLKY